MPEYQVGRVLTYSTIRHHAVYMMNFSDVY